MGEDYLEQLRYVDKYIENKDNFLDIGCGNGCFLKKAKEFGYTHVYGVEPSKHAVNQADPIIKDFIINDVFKKGLFKEGFFDLVCAIQVFDHLVEPNDVLINIEKVLKKRGFILTINHNIRFLLTKILGEKSPMYDIEHIYLFDKVTMARLLEKHGFKCLYLKDMWSRYTIGHILKMFPFPNLIKNLLQRAISQLGVKDKKIKLMGGNIVAFAQKVD